METEKTYRIVIAEDHRILREGLRALVSSESAYLVVGEADNGRDAIRRVDELKPDLILMDLSMPRMNGLDAISEIKSRYPDTKLLVLTVHKAEEYVFESLKSGADGYVLKDATHAELMLAISSVLDGKRYISPGVSATLVEGFLEGRKPSRSESSFEALTKRERQVLKLIGEGHKNKDIADYLCISAKTVEKHRANLMKKLDLHNASAMTAYAIEKGLANK
ncbi:MAG: response regulator transcription factor [Deltaproteobacteria bacterium]|nr:response regulator transcription factor [Deltaproteobacteria bacterium]